MEKNSSKNGNKQVDKGCIRKSVSLIDYVIMILLSFMISFGAIFVYDRFFVPKIAIVDLDAYVNSLKAVYMLGKIKEGDLDRYMDAAINNIKSKKDRYLIILGGVVLSRPRGVEVIPLPEIPGAKDLRIEDLLRASQNSTLLSK